MREEMKLMTLHFTKLRDMIYFTRKENLVVLEYSKDTGAIIVQYDNTIQQKANDFNFYLRIERAPAVIED